MKTGLLILNLAGILMIFGAMKACEEITTSNLFTGISTLYRSDALNQTKIKETFPNPDQGIENQVLNCIFPENNRNIGSIIAFPAIFILSINSLILGLLIIREKKGNQTLANESI